MSKHDLARQWKLAADRMVREAQATKDNKEYQRLIHEAMRLRRRAHVLLTGEEPV